MTFNFSKGASFDLHKVDNDDISKNAAALLVDGEKVIGVYKTVRDQIVFTTKRIIAVDIQGLTGKQQELATLPYANIQYFTIKTAGPVELLQDTYLTIYFANGMTADFEFRGRCDILEIGRNISRYALD
ncbi:PH domain-containing protein [Methanosarcinaceae archaeon]|nr:PH domain-containing protein [Methanosarcinaceae archaeon]